LYWAIISQNFVLSTKFNSLLVQNWERWWIYLWLEITSPIIMNTLSGQAMNIALWIAWTNGHNFLIIRQVKWGSVRREEKRKNFFWKFRVFKLDAMCFFFCFGPSLWVNQLHLPTHDCHVLVRLPHKRFLNGIWRQRRKPNFSTHAGTNLLEKNIQGLKQIFLEHTGTKVTFKSKKNSS
jgi:hypothetical protein